jgi:2-oxoglutarate dehydrogenase E2 component (dihydrolipoamide succinyltransferase)
MSTEVKIPSVGESITSGVLAAWHKKDGDFVRANEPILTLETDKVSTEIGATVAGKLIIQVKEGEEVKIGETVALIEEGAMEAPGTIPAIPAPDKLAPAPEAAPMPTAETTTKNLSAAEPALPLSPAVRRLAEEEKLATDGLTGSGKGGRLTKGDLVEQLEKRAAKPAEIAAPAATPASPASGPLAERTTRRKLSPLRRKIAAQLVMAQQTAAILTTFNECDMSGVMALRAKMQDAFTKKHGVKLGFMSFFIKAVVEALRAVPTLNGQLDGDEFVQNHYHDIGVAVGTDRGLIVPVVRDADRKSFAQIEKDLGAYATKAREGKIGLDDLTGGVFTVSNGGTYGSLLSTPILNPPQSGILGMHNIVQRPIAVNGEVVIRPMMYLALSYDHRVVDGKEAVTALVRIKDCVEDPSRMLLEV